MIELRHQSSEPAGLEEFRDKNPRGWDDVEFHAVRESIRRQLNCEQNGLCVYCETRLGEDDGHVEHIKSKKNNPAFTFVYDNLAHSCSNREHCGHRKGHQRIPIEPRPDCNRFFALMALDGRLTPADGLGEAEVNDAATTITVLGLNVPALARQRKNFIDAVRTLSAADKASFINSAPFRWCLQGI